MADGLKTTIKGDTGAEELVGRLRNQRPALAAIAPMLEIPGNYTRPDRFVGGAGRSGEIESWAPGYRNARRKVKVKKKRLELESSRPFHPILTPGADARITEMMAEYTVSGKLERK